MKWLFCILFSAMIVACGGGESNDNASPPPKELKSYSDEAKPENSSIPTSENLAPFIGVYNVSDSSLNPGDEIYYTINSKGIIRTFDYQNDAVDSAGNCYAQATKSPLKANYDLEGRHFYWDDAGQRLVMTYRGKILSIDLDGDGIPYRSTYNGIISTNVNILSPNGSLEYQQPMLLMIRYARETSGPTMNDLNNGRC